MPRRSDRRAAAHPKFKSEKYKFISPKPTARAKGTTLLELLVVLAVIGVLFAMAAPNFKNTFSSAHLSSSTSAISGAIQSTRYKAIVSGCQYQIVFSQGTTTYQLTSQALTGTPSVVSDEREFYERRGGDSLVEHRKRYSFAGVHHASISAQRHSDSGEWRLDRVRYQRARMSQVVKRVYDQHDQRFRSRQCYGYQPISGSASRGFSMIEVVTALGGSVGGCIVRRGVRRQNAGHRPPVKVHGSGVRAGFGKTGRPEPL